MNWLRPSPASWATPALDWDTSKPDGTPRKLLDVSRLEALGWKPEILLEEGIRNTLDWYVSQLSAAPGQDLKNLTLHSLPPETEIEGVATARKGD